VLQLVPVYPAAQVHVYSLSPSVHVPPLEHGELAQSSMSAKYCKILYVNAACSDVCCVLNTRESNVSFTTFLFNNNITCITVYEEQNCTCSCL